MKQLPFFKKILFEETSEFNGKVQVVDLFGVRRLIASNFTQSRSLDKLGRSEIYWDSFGELATAVSATDSILILGLGAGTSAQILRKRFPDAQIVGVEIDPMMIQIGKKYFDLDKINVDIRIENAKDFVARTKNKFDLIYLDVFIGGVAPGFISEVSFFQGLQNIITGDGELVVNSIYRKKSDAENYEAFFKQHFDMKDKILTSKSYDLGNLIMKGVNY